MKLGYQAQRGAPPVLVVIPFVGRFVGRAMGEDRVDD